MKLDVEAFLRAPGTVIDVRSPLEFKKGHIPQACNIPLFSDRERAEVGTVYKNQGADSAAALGWEIAAPKITQWIECIEETCQGGPAKVHCWRGGMRSEAFCELAKAAGFETAVLRGGYKAYRHWCRNLFLRKTKFHVLGGLTGTGKSPILQALKAMGEQVLDLEELANHRGSAFGGIGKGPQPSTEQFHNDCAAVLSDYDPEKPVWIEDEGRRIGTCHLPEALYDKIRQSPLVCIERPLRKRLEILKQIYGSGTAGGFVDSVKKIRKRLGGQTTAKVIEHIHNGELRCAAEIVLRYYDSAYAFDLSRRKQTVYKVDAADMNHHDSAKALLSLDIGIE